MPRARPSTRSRGCSASASPAARLIEKAAARRRPGPLRVPARVARAGELGLLVQRPQDRRAPRRARPRPGPRSAPARRNAALGLPVADLAASFQAAVIDVLAAKAARAATEFGATAWRSPAAWPPTAPCCAASKPSPSCRSSARPRALCTDNGAMIAARRLLPLSGRPARSVSARRSAQPADRVRD